MEGEMEKKLAILRKEMEDELQNILNYWMENTFDTLKGGYYGKVDDKNQADPSAPKGLVMNSRILWTFSAAFLYTSDKSLLLFADRAYDYIKKYFLDEEYGGLFWTVTAEGRRLEDKKQVYGIAFCIYALAEYYKVSGNKAAIELAKTLFSLLDRHSYDSKLGGYFEAFTRTWQPREDLRLSQKDANERKTMNTHLHVVEAYANLYAIWPDNLLEQRLEGILQDFRKHIINAKTYHLNLFFDDNWKVKSSDISFGHDIEASWLLLEAAEILGNEGLINEMMTNSVKMSNAVCVGLNADGSLNYESDAEFGHITKERHWWVQAEAVVGFFNAWQICRDEKFLERAVDCWEFIKKHILDSRYGEWLWGVNDDYTVMAGQDKAGIWKCPYHNSRMCLEIIKRINTLT
jgi:cellobiose epimerase